MFFTIEPMLNLGRADARILEDGWTAVTWEGRPVVGPVHAQDGPGGEPVWRTAEPARSPRG